MPGKFARGSRGIRGTTRVFVVSLLLILAHAGVATSTPGVFAQQDLSQRIAAHLAQHEAEFIALRRDLHRNPELSGSEIRTAGIVAQQLRELGLDVRTGIGGHGVVAMLRGGRPGPLIAYRADMDAVQSSDPDPVEFRSVVPNVRHICGHDIHTTIGIALASALSSVKNELAGSVMFIFQPAEERATGARAMLADGIFSREKPVAIFGLHTSPLETGTFGTRAGGLMAARDFVTVEVKGQPGANVVPVAARVRGVLNALSTITEDQQFQPAPDNFTFVQLLPDQHGLNSVTVRGWVMLASRDVRARIRTAVSRLLVAPLDRGVSIQQSYEEARIAGVSNDSVLTARSTATLRRVFGDSAVLTLQTVMPAFSEDFGSFQEHIPGVFFFLGVSNSARGWVGMPHTPGYVADERSIVIGARAMAAVILAR